MTTLRQFLLLDYSLSQVTSDLLQFLCTSKTTPIFEEKKTPKILSYLRILSDYFYTKITPLFQPFSITIWLFPLSDFSFRTLSWLINPILWFLLDFSLSTITPRLLLPLSIYNAHRLLPAISKFKTNPRLLPFQKYKMNLRLLPLPFQKYKMNLRLLPHQPPTCRFWWTHRLLSCDYYQTTPRPTPHPMAGADWHTDYSLAKINPRLLPGPSPTQWQVLIETKTRINPRLLPRP